MNILKRMIYITVFLSVLTGCAKRGMLVKSGKSNYKTFLKEYKPLIDIHSLKGNGDFEVNTKDNNFFGNFSMSYLKEPEKWTMTLFGLFGMVLSEIIIENDSITIFSSLLAHPYRSSLKNSELEAYTGISVNPRLIPLLTTGRIPLPTKEYPSSCRVKNKNLVEFLFEDKTENISFEWDRREKQVSYYLLQEKNARNHFEVKFSGYRATQALQLPYSITFLSKGKDRAYLKLKYSYIGLSTK